MTGKLSEKLVVGLLTDTLPCLTLKKLFFTLHSFSRLRVDHLREHDLLPVVHLVRHRRPVQPHRLRMQLGRLSGDQTENLASANLAGLGRIGLLGLGFYTTIPNFALGLWA